jgi:dTDP-4-amino-4,6-dideoxygalactose transaminase
MSITKKKIQYPFGTISIPEKSKKLILEALETKQVSCGKYVHQFEQAFAKMNGTKEAVAVSSGTDADTLALAVLYDYGAQRGDEIIIPALSFVATGNAVLHAGFTPVFVDVELNTLNIDPGRIEKVITPRTRAIMPVHLMGKPAKMDEINAIAKKHKLMVIEDAAEAHGTEYKGKKAGTLGAMGAYSLYVAHIITTIEGGIIVTDNTEYAEILRSLRSHGRACKCKTCVINSSPQGCPKRFKNGEDIRFIFERIGYSCKMNELEAAVGIGNMDIYQDIITKRRENLLYLIEQFERFQEYLFTITEEKHEKIGPHALPIIVQKGSPFTRNELVIYLEEHGIDSRNMFPSMPTQCPQFAYLGHKYGQFPNTEFIANNGLHVGVHQDLTRQNLDHLLNVLAEFIRKHLR